MNKKMRRGLWVLVVLAFVVGVPVTSAALPSRSFMSGDALVASDFQLLWDTVNGLEQRPTSVGWCFRSDGMLESTRGGMVTSSQQATGHWQFNVSPALSTNAPCTCSRTTSNASNVVLNLAYSAGSTLNVRAVDTGGGLTDVSGCCVCLR